jgi:RNA polymerase sigma-70 factor, ECF subfamily
MWGSKSTPGTDRESIDKKLINRTLSGENRAFTELVEHYSQIWYAIALSIVHQPELAEDILQEAVITIFDSLRDLQNRKKFSYWAVTIIRRTSYRAIRSNIAGEQLISKLAIYEKIMQDSSSRVGADIEELLLREKNEIIINTIYSLPKNYRDVAILFFLKEMELENIAELLNINLHTVRMNLYRARKLLQRKLEDII